VYRSRQLLVEAGEYLHRLLRCLRERERQQVRGVVVPREQLRVQPGGSGEACDESRDGWHDVRLPPQGL